MLCQFCYGLWQSKIKCKFVFLPAKQKEKTQWIQPPSNANEIQQIHEAPFLSRKYVRTTTREKEIVFFV